MSKGLKIESYEGRVMSRQGSRIKKCTTKFSVSLCAPIRIRGGGGYNLRRNVCSASRSQLTASN